MGWFSRNKDKRRRARAKSSEPTLSPGAGLPPVPTDLESTVDFELDVLVERLARLLPHVLEQEVDRPLVHARLADAYRDADEQPMPPDEFLVTVETLDEDGWRRLALLTGLLDEPQCREGLEELLLHATGNEAATQMQEAFISFAHDTSLLSAATLRGSELRREEFVRRWLSRLGAGIVGEAISASLERLARLDYGKLLGDAERARLIAEERLAYLDKLQQAQDAARRPRGKW